MWRSNMGSFCGRQDGEVDHSAECANGVLKEEEKLRGETSEEQKTRHVAEDGGLDDKIPSWAGEKAIDRAAMLLGRTEKQFGKKKRSRDALVDHDAGPVQRPTAVSRSLVSSFSDLIRSTVFLENATRPRASRLSSLDRPHTRHQFPTTLPLN